MASAQAIALQAQIDAKRAKEEVNLRQVIEVARLARASTASPGSVSLPRPAATFQPYAFGPGTPIPPVPIDEPDQITGRPQPRRSQYPIAFNLPVGVPGFEGLKLVSFQMIRAYAEANSFVRSCIEVRKNEILGFDYDIVPTKEATKRMQGDTAYAADLEFRRRMALAFWARPDPDFDSFHSFLSALLESALVDDAIALYLWPSRVPGMGMFGTDMAAISLLDGSTVRPVLDSRGGTPRPPEVAYQQYLWGVPRVDLSDVIHMEDLHDMGDREIEEQYTRDQLLYVRLVPRVWTPYGFPPTERAIISTITYLKRQESWLEYFTEGTIPAAWVTIGGEANASPQQAGVWETNLNAVAGDTGYKQKIRVLPQGSSVHEMVAARFDPFAVRAVQDDIMGAFDVFPTEVGLAPQAGNSGLGGKGTEEAHQAMSKRKATKPFLKALNRGVFNYIMQSVWGQHDLEMKWVGMDAVEDELRKAQVHKTYTSFGGLTLNDVRVDIGREPYDDPEANAPLAFTGTGPVPIGNATATARALSAAGQMTQEGSEISGETPESLAGDAQVDAQTAAAADAGTQQGQNITSDASMQRVERIGPVALERSILAKSAKTEMEQLLRYRKHGRKVSDFHAEFLWPGIVKAVADGNLEHARRLFKVQSHVMTRNAQVAPIRQRVKAQLTDLAMSTRGKAATAFATAAQKALQSGYEDAYTAGQTEYDPDYDYSTDDAGQAKVADRVAAAAAYLSGWVGKLADQSPAQVEQTADNYSQGMQPAWDEGFTDGVVDDQPEAVIIWNTQSDGEVCPLCEDRDGTQYAPDDLPGYPGDGEFGELCDGGFNCRCGLDYEGPDGSALFR